MTEPTTTATAPATDELAPERFAEMATRIETEVGTFIVGQHELVRQTLISLIAGGHALLEGVPGLGKTMLVRTMAEALDLGFSPHPVHAGPDARRHHRHEHHRRGGRRAPLPLPAGTDLRQPRAGRRDQPRHAEDAVGAAGGDAGAPRDRRRSSSTRCRSRSSCWRRRTRSRWRAPIRCRRRSSTASSSRSTCRSRPRRTWSAIMERTTGVESPTVGKAATGGRGAGDAAPGARRPDRVARDGLRHPPPARHASRDGARAGDRQELTSATARPRAARRPWCSGRRSTRCSTAASTWPTRTSRPSRRPALRHRIILNFEGEAEGISTDSVVRAIIAETPTEPAE